MRATDLRDKRSAQGAFTIREIWILSLVLSLNIFKTAHWHFCRRVYVCVEGKKGQSWYTVRLYGADLFLDARERERDTCGIKTPLYTSVVNMWVRRPSLRTVRVCSGSRVLEFSDPLRYLSVCRSSRTASDRDKFMGRICQVCARVRNKYLARLPGVLSDIPLNSTLSLPDNSATCRVRTLLSVRHFHAFTSHSSSDATTFSRGTLRRDSADLDKSEIEDTTASSRRLGCGHLTLIAGVALGGAVFQIFDPSSTSSIHTVHCKTHNAVRDTHGGKVDGEAADTLESKSKDQDAGEFFVEKNTDQTFQVFTGTSNPELAREVCSHLGEPKTMPIDTNYAKLCHLVE